MTPEVVQAPVAVELAAIALGAVFGALLAVRRGFDALGLLGLALLGGLGGGVVRDVLLDLRPVALTDVTYVPTAVGTAAVVFFFARGLDRVAGVLDVLDAAVMGLYAVAGASKALSAAVGPGGAVLVGLVSAVAGGALCDVVSARPVSIFRPGPVHATAPLAGAAVFVALDELEVIRAGAVLAGIAVTLLLRLLGLRRGVQVPTPRVPS